MYIHFTHIYNSSLFASKPTFARIVFLRQGGRWVTETGTHSVKILTENDTKTHRAHRVGDVKNTRFSQTLPSTKVEKSKERKRDYELQYGQRLHIESTNVLDAFIQQPA